MPAGSHVARAVRIIDIGTHHGDYQGKPTVRNQFVLQWEIPAETIEIDGEEKPMLVSKFYTNSLSEKANLRRDLESWRARPFSQEELMKFDLMNVLGKPCMLSVIHSDAGKARVSNVSALPKGTTCPPAFNAPDAFWIAEWDQTKFDAFPEGFKKLIRASDEYQARGGDGAPAVPARTNDFDDDIPF